MDKGKLRKSVVEIIAHHIDTKEQMNNGVVSHDIDHERWINRYMGRQGETGIPRMIVLNTFKNEVDMVVAKILHATESA